MVDSVYKTWADCLSGECAWPWRIRTRNGCFEARHGCERKSNM